MATRIVLLGPPGAGKGTQAKTLAKELNLPHISTGDILRQNVSQDSELGRKAKDFMNKGALVPDELVGDMLAERLSQSDTKNGFILDGYPRNISQAESLDKMLRKNNNSLELVVYLDTSEPVIIQRLGGRLVCSACGANFHTRNMPPKKDMLCDNCGARLYQRPDDNPETVKKRLEVYLKESSPVVRYYQERKKLYRLNSDLDAGVVLKEILGLAKKIK